MSNSAYFEEDNHTALYKQYRPEYPQCLFDRIIAYLKENHTGPFELAVDVGCGNGLATKYLCETFAMVNGYDISESQLKHARQLEKTFGNVNFFQNQAERIESLNDSSVDLIITAAAIHWFDIEKFLIECRRLLKPSIGSLAIIGYYGPYFECGTNETLTKQLTQTLDVLLDCLKPYFPPQVTYLLNRYGDIKPETQQLKDVVRDNETYRIDLVNSIDYIASLIETYSSYQLLIAKNPQATCLEKFKNDSEEILKQHPDHQFSAYMEVYLILCRN